VKADNAKRPLAGITIASAPFCEFAPVIIRNTGPVSQLVTKVVISKTVGSCTNQILELIPECSIVCVIRPVEGNIRIGTLGIDPLTTIEEIKVRTWRKSKVSRL
jgi:hypothetical protein